MKARIPKHREFVINLETTAEERREECWAKLEAILEDYKKEGKSVYTPSFIEDNEEKVKALQAEYGFEYTIELPFLYSYGKSSAAVLPFFDKLFAALTALRV